MSGCGFDLQTHLHQGSQFSRFFRKKSSNYAQNQILRFHFVSVFQDHKRHTGKLNRTGRNGGLPLHSVFKGVRHPTDDFQRIFHCNPMQEPGEWRKRPAGAVA
jgi:hypothetical protein